MIQWKQFVKDYLSFTKKERIGVICILVILFVVYFLPYLFPPVPSSISIDEPLIRNVDSSSANLAAGTVQEDPENLPDQYEASIQAASKGELFQFDPNSLSLEGWSRLGLNSRAIRTINNYRTKGGKFYKREDLQKIWGLPAGFYERVKEHIHIPSRDNEAREVFRLTASKKNLAFEINSADTSAFIALPGIGSKLASRIINFREKLGGFYAPEQVAETYGLPDSTFQKIKSLLDIDPSLVRKMNINTASKEDLKTHPYIKWNLANTLVEYRNQHGPYQNIEAIRNIANLEEPVFQKLKFYLVVD